MQEYELIEWLGPAAAEMDEDQMGRVRDAAAWTEGRWPGEDDADDREAALSATVQYLLGDASPEQVGHALVAARVAAQEALVAAQAVARAACEDGMAEAEAGRVLGLDRMTVRRARGK